MTSTIERLEPGSDCRELFKTAYENRYTWEPSFGGYRGLCSLNLNTEFYEGKFEVSENLKSHVFGIDDQEVEKLINSQLWEVTIHRVRRPFDQVHSDNHFVSGEFDDNGLEVLINGKNSSDKYKVKNNIITMVNRHIHGSLIKIYTDSVMETRKGYLSTGYTSQYFDPSKGSECSAISHFKDKFCYLEDIDEWVLSERVIETGSFGDKPSNYKKFKFYQMTKFY